MSLVNRLTDRQIAQLYFGFSEDYVECLKHKDAVVDRDAIYAELYWRLVSSINNGPLSNLDPQDRDKPFKILNTFFQSCYAQPPQPYFYNYLPPQQYIYIIPVTTRAPRYCHHNFLFDWMLLNSLNRPYYGSGFNPVLPVHHRGVFGGGIWASHGDNDGSLVAFLLLLAVIAIATMLAFVAMYHLLCVASNSIERIWNNEGWMQACVSFLSMAAAGAASTILATLFVAEPLTGLAIAAGLTNPAGVVIIGIICLGIIGAAVGNYLTDMIQNYLLKKMNPEALDPTDPHRYIVTDDEASHLLRKGYDPIKVKCAIVGLRAAMELGNEELPSRLSLFSRRTKEIQDNLNTIRMVRRGEGALHALQVGHKTFDCRLDAPAVLRAYQVYADQAGVYPNVPAENPPAYTTLYGQP